MKIKKRISLAGLATTGAVALVLGMTSAPAMAAVSPTFGNAKLVGASSTSTGTKDVPFTLSFDGPAADNNTYYKASGSAKMIGYNTKIRSSYLKKIQGVYPTSGAPTPDAPKRVDWSIYDLSTSPGKWRVSATVTKNTWNGSTYVQTRATAHKDIVVNASTSYSKRNTSLSGSARAGKTFPLTVRAPYYQVGAKVSVYFKAKGSKRFKKVATSTLKSGDAYSSKVTIKISKKHNVAGKGGKIYVKVGARPYAGAYQSATGTIRRY